MADKKKKSQAEKVVSAAKNKNKTATGKNGGKEGDKGAKKEQLLPIRFYTAATFLGLFILFLIMSLSQEGWGLLFLREIVYGLIGAAGFIISIPILLYLFFIHAFSGKRPVKMRTICLSNTR